MPKLQTLLHTCYSPANQWEIGIGEAGRGPLFGRLYVAATVLPKAASGLPKATGDLPKAISDLPKAASGLPKAISDLPKAISDLPKAISDLPKATGDLPKATSDLPKAPEANTSKESDFRHDWMKDSKRFSSDKKIREVADYIKTHAVAWSIQYVEPDIIDEINIRQAVLRAMRLCAQDILKQLPTSTPQHDVCLLVDGNDFPVFTVYHEPSQALVQIPHHTIEGGDNLYTCIAAASILAKVARDDHIEELCKQRPELVEKYAIDKNKGYGTKRHMEGIATYGITELHRKSYKPCKVV